MATLEPETQQPAAIGLLGGTFDPLHFGHLRIALEAQNLLALKEVRFIPCHIPPHKTAPHASIDQRIQMLEVGLADNATFRIDKRELESHTPSYTVDTLRSIRAEVGPCKPIIFIMGMDSFLTLPTWRQWQRLIEFAHLLIVGRPGSSLHANEQTTNDTVLGTWLQLHKALSPKELTKTPHGKLYLLQTPLLEISSSMIRQMISENRSPQYLLANDVLTYIQAQGLYKQER